MAGLLPLERSTLPLAFIAVFGSRIYKDGDEDALWYFVLQGGLQPAVISCTTQAAVNRRPLPFTIPSRSSSSVA